MVVIIIIMDALCSPDGIEEQEQYLVGHKSSCAFGSGGTEHGSPKIAGRASLAPVPSSSQETRSLSRVPAALLGAMQWPQTVSGSRDSDPRLKVALDNPAVIFHQKSLMRACYIWGILGGRGVGEQEDTAQASRGFQASAEDTEGSRHSRGERAAPASLAWGPPAASSLASVPAETRHLPPESSEHQPQAPLCQISSQGLVHLGVPGVSAMRVSQKKWGVRRSWPGASLQILLLLPVFFPWNARAFFFPRVMDLLGWNSTPMIPTYS